MYYQDAIETAKSLMDSIEYHYELVGLNLARNELNALANKSPDHVRKESEDHFIFDKQFRIYLNQKEGGFFIHDERALPYGWSGSYVLIKDGNRIRIGDGFTVNGKVLSISMLSLSEYEIYLGDVNTVLQEMNEAVHNLVNPDCIQIKYYIDCKDKQIECENFEDVFKKIALPNPFIK